MLRGREAPGQEKKTPSHKKPMGRTEKRSIPEMMKDCMVRQQKTMKSIDQMSKILEAAKESDDPQERDGVELRLRLARYPGMPEFVLKFKLVISVTVTVVFVALLILESRFSLRERKRPTLERWLVNVVVSGLALAAGAYVVAPVALNLASRSPDNSFGLLRIVPLPFAAEFILGFLLLDLTFYYWHRANHEFAFFWRFHNVHHVDPDLDVSTSFRFHLGEALYSVGFRALQVYVLGVSLITFLVYELVFQCATMFHHSNVNLPIRAERWLNKIIVTPRMHGIHHSIVEAETNSNFSVVFRWWDLMHGTLRLNVGQADIVIGVPAYLQIEDNKLWRLLTVPFRKQRQYWLLPSGEKAERETSNFSRNILLP